MFSARVGDTIENDVDPPTDTAAFVVVSNTTFARATTFRVGDDFIIRTLCARRAGYQRLSGGGGIRHAIMIAPILVRFRRAL